MVVLGSKIRNLLVCILLAEIESPTFFFLEDLLVGRLEALGEDLLPLLSDNDQPLHHAAIRLP